MLPHPSNDPAAPEGAHADAPRAVRDPEAFERTLGAWCFTVGRRPDPEIAPWVATTWWDSDEGRLYGRGIQLIQRQRENGVAELEIVAPDRRLPLALHALGHWLIRGRAMVPLLRVRTLRRFWGSGPDAGLESVRWEGPAGRVHVAVRVRGDDAAARRFLASAPVQATLGSDHGITPSWPDHASSAVRAWMGPDTAVDSARVFVAAARLQRELLRENSALRDLMTEHLTELFAREGSAGATAGAPAHPLWQHALRRSLDAHADEREAFLDHLAHCLRPRELAAMHRDPVRLAAILTALRAAAPWIDAPLRKTLRTLRASHALAADRAQLESIDAILVTLLRSQRAAPEAALEVGARLRRLEREILVLRHELDYLGPPRLRAPLRLWARTRRRSTPTHGES